MWPTASDLVISMPSIADKEPFGRFHRTKGVAGIRFLMVLGLALCLVVPAFGAEPSPGKKPAATKSTLNGDSKAARELLNNTVDEYKLSLAKLRDLQQKNAHAAEAKAVKLRELLSSQIVSVREVESAELEFARAKADLDKTTLELDHADGILEEVAALDKLLTLPNRPNSYVSTGVLIRYSGTRWNMSEVSKVDGFFTSRFGRRAPISAFGQTALHSRLGFDHSNAIDIATHPDSAEGQALMEYLRASGIPFLAFRSAVPGKATGPHIHVGLPSRRLGR